MVRITTCFFTALALCFSFVPVAWADEGQEAFATDAPSVPVLSLGEENPSGQAGDEAIDITDKEHVDIAGREQRTWYRLSGKTAYDTMETITKVGWKTTKGTVLIATGENYPDALAAAGVAGLSESPVLITSSSSLSEATKRELVRLAPSKVIIVGGRFAVRDAVKQHIEKAVPQAQVVRLKGGSATETAAVLNTEHKTLWSDTAIVATPHAFQDALSAAPLAFAKHMPIFLVEDKDKLSAATIAAMKECGIKKVIVVGGKYCVSDKAKQQLANNGMPVVETLKGGTAYETSAKIAEWARKNGLDNPGVAISTAKSFPDALTGAALCGGMGIPLLLTDAGNTNPAHSTIRPQLSKLDIGLIFGGRYAVPYDTLALTVHGPYAFKTLAAAGVAAANASVSDARLNKELYAIEGTLLELGYDKRLAAFSPYDRATAVLEYVGGTYYYDGNVADGWKGSTMLNKGGGNCFAYSELTYCLCKKLGINCWLTIPGRHESSFRRGSTYGSQHRSVVALIDGKYYDLDANSSYNEYLMASMLGMPLEPLPYEYPANVANYLIGKTNKKP